MKLRESVNIPTNRLSNPTLESAFSCHSNAFLLVQEPPPTTKMELAREYRAVLEIADHASDNYGIIGGIEVIQDHLGQFSSRFQLIQGSARTVRLAASRRWSRTRCRGQTDTSGGDSYYATRPTGIAWSTPHRHPGPPKEAQHEAAKLQESPAHRAQRPGGHAHKWCSPRPNRTAPNNKTGCHGRRVGFAPRDPKTRCRACRASSKPVSSEPLQPLAFSRRSTHVRNAST